MDYPLIENVLDIDSEDPEVIELAKLADEHGVFNMQVAWMKVTGLQNSNGQRVSFVFDETTYREVVSTFIAVAVINMASWKYQDYLVRVDGTYAQRLSRSGPPEEHLETVRTYVAQAASIMEKYG